MNQQANKQPQQPEEEGLRKLEKARKSYQESMTLLGYDEAEAEALSQRWMQRMRKRMGAT